MKWADHCSSDEESIDDLPEQMEQQATLEENEAPTTGPTEDAPAEDTAPPKERVYEFPDKPPFTAFVGNLSWNIKEAEALQEAVSKLVQDRLGQSINVMGGRVATNRSDGKPRGFGYVEVETVEELKLLMTLNDGESLIEGRKIQLDTANQHQRRGNNNHRHNHRGRRGDGPADGSKFRGGFGSKDNSNSDGGPPAQRTSLKLAPRSHKDASSASTPSSSSSIFGGAKARDEQTWEKSHGNDNQHRHHGRGGRGGRGGGRGGRDGGRGGGRDNPPHKRNNNNNNNKGDNPKHNNKDKEEKAPTPKPQPTEMPAPVKKPTTTSNKFALLMDDSDSD